VQYPFTIQRVSLMPANELATLTFVLITSFTPGPSNVSSAAMGALHGYRRTLKYLFGMTSGFLFVMFLCAWISASLLSLLPTFEPLLRYAGAAYILYLAYGILKASYSFDSGAVKPMGFASGFLLQLLNPKLIVYGLTLFSTFLASVSQQPPQMMVALMLLALTAFCAISVWTLFGTIIGTYLRHPRARLVVNGILALLLVYTALNLANVV